MKTALVLSGGGAHGDFELGAVRCLYDRGIVPDILAGTSVGSINAAKLAEGENPTNPGQGLAGLEAIWFSLMTNDDMYLSESWLHDPDMDPKIASLLLGTSSSLGIYPPTRDDTYGDLSHLAYILEGAYFLLTDGQSVMKSIGVIVNQARSLYNLSPIRARMHAGLDTSLVSAWAATGRQLRLAMVSLEAGTLRYVTETAAVIERDGSAVPDLDHPPAACTSLGATVDGLISDIASLRQDKADVQSQLATAQPGQKAGLVAKAKALNAQIDAKTAALATAQAALAACTKVNPTLPLTIADLREGIMASASIPGIFLPVKLGRDYYVDGGIQEGLPLQVAVDLKADRIFAVQCSSPTLPSYQTPVTAGILSIVSRSLKDLTLAEINRDDIRVTPPATGPAPSIVLIQPVVDVHDFLVIDPGLIRITRDYGYMRAADALDGATDPRAKLATDIATLRRDIWRLENQAAGQPDPTQPGEPAPAANPGLQATINQQKAALATLITARRTAAGSSVSMPADIDIWATQPERHPWTVPAINNAGFQSQKVPASLKAGAMAPVSVTMTNTGSTTWTAAGNYRLGSQSPQDNKVWGLQRVELAGPVRPGESVTFNFSIQSAAPGSTAFQWRMVRDGVQWFGDLTDPVNIAVLPATEPAQCATFRSQIADANAKIAALTDALTGDAHSDAAKRAQIVKLQQQVASTTASAKALGCVV